jgi:hypothetical protein
MEKIALLNSLPFFVSVVLWLSFILAILIAGLHVYYGITRTCFKLKFVILLWLERAKLLIQRSLLRKPTTRYNLEETPSFAPLTLSDLSPESNPVLPLSKSEKLSYQKTARKQAKRGANGRFIK